MPDPEFDVNSKGPALGTAKDRLVAHLGGRERALIAAAVGFQLLVLVGIVMANTIPWAGSGVRTVLLKVEPVDPRDLMRGDYVILGYEISRVPPGTFLGGSSARERAGRTVYVMLEPDEDGRHYHGVGVVEEPPANGPFIRGTLEASGRIVFGIESYFVQEGKGKEYEQAVRDRRLSAEVALSRDGRAALRRLVFD
jgi:uncharacterized membrane-anchored protein